MGCGGSKPDDEPGSPSGSRTSAKGASSPARKGNKVVEELFRANGVERNLGADEVLIEQGSTMQNAFYIKSGRVKLLQKGEDGNITNLATRGVGDVLGELSLLLGHPATVTAVTDGAAVVIEVTQEQLMTQLREEPAMSGRLFKAMAVALAEHALCARWSGWRRGWPRRRQSRGTGCWTGCRSTHRETWPSGASPRSRKPLL